MRQDGKKKHCLFATSLLTTEQRSFWLAAGIIFLQREWVRQGVRRCESFKWLRGLGAVPSYWHGASCVYVGGEGSQELVCVPVRLWIVIAVKLSLVHFVCGGLLLKSSLEETIYITLLTPVSVPQKDPDVLE